MAFASESLVPFGHLPTVLQRVSEYLPASHFGKLAYRIVMP